MRVCIYIHIYTYIYIYIYIYTYTYVFGASLHVRLLLFLFVHVYCLLPKARCDSVELPLLSAKRRRIPLKQAFTNVSIGSQRKFSVVLNNYWKLIQIQIQIQIQIKQDTSQMWRFDRMRPLRMRNSNAPCFTLLYFYCPSR